MDNATVAENLGSLVQLDIDAVHAYDQAIKRIEVSTVREQLVRFRGDHERHITELSDYIRSIGEEPPEYSRDFKGFLIEGFTAIRSSTGTEGALKAMKSNEQKTNKDYNEALSWELPAEARTIVQRNYDDERRHLRYVEQCLDQCVWETASAR